jgi:tetratricopeptide (TPR) repeat protein
LEALKIEAGAHRLAIQGRHQEAIAEYTRAIGLAPDMPVLYHERGVSYTWTGDLAAAIADFDTALRLDPQRPSSLYERGAAYYRLADFARAEEDLRAAVDMTSDPDVVIPAMRLLDSIRSGDAALGAAGR